MPEIGGEVSSHSTAIDWDRIRSLHGVRKLVEALHDLGIPRINLLLLGHRQGDLTNSFFEQGFLYNDLRPFCAFVQQNPQGRKNCQKTCFKEWVISGDNGQRTVQHTCHAGLKNLMTPLVVGGKQVGNLGLGQFLESSDDASLARILQGLGEMAANATVSSSQLSGVPNFSVEKREILGTLMEAIADEIKKFLDEQREKTTRRNPLSPASTQGVISKSKRMIRILAQLPEIARSQSTVMIYGESGTGKEKLARVVHEMSDREKENLVTINCAALTASILEAELFGFKKGSFTHAYADRTGLFEKANQGTMFLDEIGDMPMSLQVKLLRVLQEGTFLKVGDTESQQVDVRIIAATNKNIPDMIQKGLFRQDLYFRLAVIEINLPPLRERREDIALLVTYFIDLFCERMNKTGIRFSEEAMNYLLNFEWPGNVRELQNEIERAVALASNNATIQADNLSKRLTEIRPIVGQGGDENRTLKEMVGEYEKALILRALHEERWNKTRISEKLGLTRQGLMKKIEKYGLDKRKR